MSILQDEQPLSMEGVYPDSHCCIGCRFNTHPGAPPRALAEFLMQRDGNIPMTINWDSELYIVKDSIWKKAGVAPWGGCLCVGCLERRIGRKLKPKDFPPHVLNDPRLPCTDRLRERRGRAFVVEMGAE